MNNKITLAKLASELSAATGCSEATAEQFLKVLIDDFSDTIADGGAVRIDGIGELKADSTAHDVAWTIDADLAALVNEPFSAFEPVVLETGVTEEMLEGDADTPQEQPLVAEDEPQEVKEPMTEPEAEIEEPEPEDVQPLPEPESETEPEPEPELEAAAESEPEPAAAIEQPQEAVETPETSEEPEMTPAAIETVIPEYPKAKKRNPLIPWIFFLVGLVAGLTIGYIAGLCCHSSNSDEVMDAVVVEEPEPKAVTTPVVVPVDSTTTKTAGDSIVADSSVTVAAEPKAESVVVDTVTASRYLTTLSRKYFGDFRFWIYIYEENKDKIENPDRIKPGTAVVIPKKDKYGINSEDPESVKKAEGLIREYYNNHKK